MFPVLRSACAAARPARLSRPKPLGSRYFSKSHTFSRLRVESRFSPAVVVIGLIPIFTFALGTWQVRRRRWKLDLIEQLNDQADRAPLALPEFVNLDILPEFDFRKFVATGEWDHARAILVGPKTREGTLGYQVVTPLIRQDGSTILVDRGFVAKEYVSPDRQVRLYDQPKGAVKVLGMLRTQLQKKNPFTPENKPERGEWYWPDVEGMKEWLGGDEKNVQGAFLEEIFDGNTGEISDRMSKGIPVGRPGHIELRNMHATYALTWYSLSAATAFMFLALVRKRKPLSTFR
ncbi:SURF1-domain-containing protein [Gautieria morchelliformis]|nr:SURF1-domain-containing protein [Gautieria morchelliformis]